jgi:hypothetical protein
MNAYYDDIEMARMAIDNLTKSMISELRSFNNPPVLVGHIMSVITSLIRNHQEETTKKTHWSEVKKLVSYANFVHDLQQISVHNLSRE